MKPILNRMKQRKLNGEMVFASLFPLFPPVQIRRHSLFVDMLNDILKAAPEYWVVRGVGTGYALGPASLGEFNGGVARSSWRSGSAIRARMVADEKVDLKAVCFALFIYAVGFSGRGFFGGLNRASVKLVLVHYPLRVGFVGDRDGRACFSKGFSACIGAGALTQTAMMGTARSSSSQTRIGI